MTIRRELIDELFKECSDPREILAEGGLLKQLTRALIERCLETEMEDHLGYPKHTRRKVTRNHRRLKRYEEANPCLQRAQELSVER